MLFKRYASPFDLLNISISTNDFSNFIFDFVKAVNKEREEQADWEFFLHKVYDSSFAEFKEELENNKKNRNMSKEKMRATVEESMNILNSFNPEQEGGEVL